ncbi:hypothetical protein N7466_002299 [Penicillium verhagenii]|uniref:uncharacterized protein n=1 Tax=Penicillium verhagenii TaxID=1562060 RepID=UPI002544F6FB|nr:uncharacterized protein N7466_002299 [Penicillium verhagenii]KAJ5939165.1 hypothetical protein N7466_002299 [Penicillium verhagenii]
MMKTPPCLRITTSPSGTAASDGRVASRGLQCDAIPIKLDAEDMAISAITAAPFASKIAQIRAPSVRKQNATVRTLTAGAAFLGPGDAVDDDLEGGAFFDGVQDVGEIVDFVD